MTIKKVATEYTIDNIPPTREDFLKVLVIQFTQRRKRLGYSQEYIDQIMGNSDRTCSKWECGSRTPTSFNLFCWAEALKCRITLND